MTGSKEVAVNDDSNLNKLQIFGAFQTVQFFLLCLPFVMVAMTHVNYIFVAEDLNYRCRVPECETENPTIDNPNWWPKNVDTKCFKPIIDRPKYEAQNNTCTNNVFYEVFEECTDWIYENNNSIVAELNLGCQLWKSSLVGSIHNAGMIVSMIFTGWIGDKIGRKPTVIICSVGGFIGLFKIFLTNYYAYLVIEFLESVLASGLYTVGIVLMMEVGGDSKRVITGVVFSYAVYIGEVAYAIIAMSFKYWKWIILTVYSPLILFLVYIIILKESTRWELLRGKNDKAKRTLKTIAKFNKIDVPPAEIDNTDPKELRSRFHIEEQREKESIGVIINSKEIMIRLGVTSFCFFTSSFLYYGTVVHSVLLPGNKYTNFILAAVASFPGDLLAYFTFKKFGRKITLQYGYVFSAVFLILQSYCPEEIRWLKVSLFLLGKIGVVICFTGIFTYSLELFPTSVRGSLLGWGNTAARIGGMLAPLTPLLMTEFTSLPSILFSSTAVIAAILLSFTPETKTMPLFDTIAQVESYNGKNKPI